MLAAGTAGSGTLRPAIRDTGAVAVDLAQLLFITVLAGALTVGGFFAILALLGLI
jgi:hypothetical protein